MFRSLKLTFGIKDEKAYSEELTNTLDKKKPSLSKVILLINKSAMLDEYGNNLMMICRKGSFSIDQKKQLLGLLLTKSTKALTEWNMTNNHSCLHKLIMNDKPVNFGLTEPTESEKAECIKVFLLHHNNVNQTISLEYDTRMEPIKGTALHLSARQNQLKIMRVLIDHGANWKIKDSKGRIAIDLISNEQAKIAMQNYAEGECYRASFIDGLAKSPRNASSLKTFATDRLFSKNAIPLIFYFAGCETEEQNVIAKKTISSEFKA
jgi:hypothetical protein